jgi:hypothetical protein
MNVEVVLENHRFVDAEKFEEFSNALRELCGVIAFVNKEVQNSA